MSNESKFHRDKCPVCGNQVSENVAFSPFCSERCKLVDLGIWFTGGYSIPAIEPPDDIETLFDEIDDG